jgi:hypothetical protein
MIRVAKKQLMHVNHALMEETLVVGYLNGILLNLKRVHYSKKKT